MLTFSLAVYSEPAHRLFGRLPQVRLTQRHKALVPRQRVRPIEGVLGRRVVALTLLPRVELRQAAPFFPSRTLAVQIFFLVIRELATTIRLLVLVSITLRFCV